jgi:PKD repeat protein
MKKFLKIFLLLGIIFGFGISCASAENISFIPNTVNLSPGSSQQVQVVMDSVPKGLAGFNITFNVSDPGIANITGVSFPSWANVSLTRNSTLPSNSAWIKAIDLDGAKPNHTVVPGATNVILGNITITGIQAGTADLSIQKTLISADGGSSITPIVTAGKINVTVIKIAPIITWNNPANITYGTSLNEIQLNATASVPGTFNYTPPAGTNLSVGTHTLYVDFVPKDTSSYTNATANVTINVTLPIFPGCANPPKVNVSDGHCEDINGNGRLDFGDLLSYFDNMEWIEDGNEPVELFDYNGNKRIDFGDLTLLFDMIP